MTRARLLAMLTLALLASTGAHALDGTVVDRDGKAISGARVCYFVDGVELICTNTDAQGRFELPGSSVDTLRAHAPGFRPTEFTGATLQGPVVLVPTPVLLVRLVDRKTGEAIDKGEVVVIYSSGKKKGPFPANANGVRIEHLDQGEVRVIGRAEGYRESEPRPLRLVEGEEASLVVELTPTGR